MKPKIPKLTKKERRTWIEALKGTLERYKNKKSYTDCLLCEVGNKCFNCVWVWFVGKWCIEYRDKYLAKYTKDIRKHHFSNPLWVKLRLRQIPRWTKKLKEDL